MSNENKVIFEYGSAVNKEKTRPMNVKSSAAGAGILKNTPNRFFCTGPPDNLLDSDKSKTI